MSGSIWTLPHPLAVLGSGIALPGEPLSGEQLITRLEQRFGFTRRREALAIARRMAIDTRHSCRDFALADEQARLGCSNPALAAKAVRAALAEAGLSVNDLGYLIGHTATPQQALPPNIALVADELGYRGPFAEFRQACTGFANGLAMASGLLADPAARPVAIVGSETGSLFFDPHAVGADAGQIVNLMQMGDGAGAAILAPAVQARGAVIEAGWFGSLGLGRAPGIEVKAGGRLFSHDYEGVAANGPALFDAGAAILADLGYPLDTIDLIVPHQVSGRIGAQAAAYFNIDHTRFFGNAARIGNVGSAAIWIALAEARATALTVGQGLATLGAEASKYMHGGFVYRHG